MKFETLSNESHQEMVRQLDDMRSEIAGLLYKRSMQKGFHYTRALSLILSLKKQLDLIKVVDEETRYEQK